MARRSSSRSDTEWKLVVEFTSETSAEFTSGTGAKFTSGTVAECEDSCGGLSQLVASPPLTSTLPGSSLLLYYSSFDYFTGSDGTVP